MVSSGLHHIFDTFKVYKGRIRRFKSPVPEKCGVLPFGADMFGTKSIIAVTLNGNTDALFEHVAQRALEEGLIPHGDTVVITAGAPVGISGKTNLLKITEV